MGESKLWHGVDFFCRQKYESSMTIDKGENTDSARDVEEHMKN